jgi:hypothetical protein
MEEGDFSGPPEEIVDFDVLSENEIRLQFYEVYEDNSVKVNPVLDFTLKEGETTGPVIWGPKPGEETLLSFSIGEIVYYSDKNSLNSAEIEITFYQTRDVHSYCDVDGEWDRQFSSGGSCQNDFECLSNSCSSGTCLDSREANKFQAWVVGMVCNIANPFSSSERQQCKDDYFELESVRMRPAQSFSELGSRYGVGSDE